MFYFCQKLFGIIDKFTISEVAYMIGPIGFVLTGIASLVSLWAYFEKVLGL